MRILTISNRPEVSMKNILQSKMLRYHDFCRRDLINDNIPHSVNTALFGEEPEVDSSDLAMLVHDDVLLPDDFEIQLIRSIYQLPDSWGVIGVAGASMENGNRVYKGHLDDRGRIFGKPFIKPQEVQTLDELLLVFNCAHAGLFDFDEQFPFDFYGADICMQAHERGLGVYVVPAFVHHNSSRKVGERTPSFYESEAKFREKWKHRLPIATTCSILR